VQSVAEGTRHKTITAAWFVSNCNSMTKRERVAAALQRYVTVDIYGHCGTKTCAEDGWQWLYLWRYDGCNELLQRKYWFVHLFC
jgi:hypothetical protein